MKLFANIHFTTHNHAAYVSQIPVRQLYLRCHLNGAMLLTIHLSVQRMQSLQQSTDENRAVMEERYRKRLAEMDARLKQVTILNLPIILESARQTSQTAKNALMKSVAIHNENVLTIFMKRAMTCTLQNPGCRSCSAGNVHLHCNCIISRAACNVRVHPLL